MILHFRPFHDAENRGNTRPSGRDFRVSAACRGGCSGTEGGGQALVGLMAIQLAEAAEWGDAYLNHGWVFSHEDGSPIEPSGISSRFRRRVKAAHVKRIPLHGLRHTHATLLLASGVPGHVVSRRLGHASEAFTLSRYANVLPQQGQEAAAKVAALVDG